MHLSLKIDCMLRGNCHLLHFVCCRKPATTKETGSESSIRAMLQGASELLDELNVPPPPKRPKLASSSRSSSLLAEMHSVSSRDQSTLPSTRSLSPPQCEDQECPVPAACDVVTTSGTANPALLAPSSPAPQQYSKYACGAQPGNICNRNAANWDDWFVVCSLAYYLLCVCAMPKVIFW